MVSGTSRNREDYFFSTKALDVSAFITSGQLESTEQIRRFELLRLAFFVLKLRKLEQRSGQAEQEQGQTQAHSSEYAFRCNLLRHVIFQQVLTLTQLDAREQALQLIAACQK